MTIVVTGSGGQLGGELCRQLGSDCLGLDLPRIDLRDRAALTCMFQEARPTAVINTAAFTAVDQAQLEPELCRQINVDAVAGLAELCRAFDSVLVQISTDYVFGDDDWRTTPYQEDDPTGPINVYGQSKLDGELAAGELRNSLVVRTCGLYGPPGPNTRSPNFVDRMLSLARRGRPLSVVADQHCTPSYTSHVARAIRHLLAVEARGVYHVINRGATTWCEFAREALRLGGVEVEVRPIKSAEYASAAARPAYSVLDGAKYHAAGGPSMPPWREALAEYIAGRA